MRSDIQVLRGVAVLAVLLCHAFPQWFGYGFLGVDLFFVISGFLMTKMIVSGMDRATFTFSGFYWRRARRLLPASFVTLAVSTVIARIVLPAADWSAYMTSLAASLTFTANMIRPDAFVHPLAHIWSLSLEEQFYFVFPLLLWFIPTKERLIWLASLAALSLFAFLMIADRTAAFYMLPFRAWELLAGGVLYVARFTKPTRLRFAPLERIGDWSYSLYLIHWPLISFAVLFCGWPLPLLTAVALCFFSIALAALQYQYVEQPFRIRQEPQRRAVMIS